MSGELISVYVNNSNNLKINCEIIQNGNNLNLKFVFLLAQYFYLSVFTLEKTQQVQGDMHARIPEQ